VGDFDNDGNVDVFINNMNEAPSLLKNSGGGNHFVNLRLVGVQSNRSAIGARVSLYAGGRRQVQEVRSGSTFLSQSDLRLHFGLGSADSARLFDPAGAPVDSYSWTAHATTTYGRCPSGSGAFTTTTEA
jgi:hypothetical protein